jgi:FkbM family methyltransferase
MSGPTRPQETTSAAPFDFARVLQAPGQGQAYWTVVDPVGAIQDSADYYLRFLRFELEAQELVSRQYARNLACFLNWAAGMGLDLRSAAKELQSFSAFLQSVPAPGGDDFLLRRPERVDQVLATVRGLYLHLVTREELPLEVLGCLHEVRDLRDAGVRSYAQNGEDLQIAYHLGRRERVSYIDVGCLWPKQFSNSYFFYERGGHGLCIDANPTVAEEYGRVRARDVFLNCAVAAAPGTMTYHMHNNPVFNTFSSAHAAELAERVAVMEDSPQRVARTLRATVEVPTMTLDEAVRSSGLAASRNGYVDFLSIDVEGLELQVLAGFSFREPRPRLVVVEDFHRGAEARLAPEESTVTGAMRAHGYRLVERAGVNLYYIDEDA